VEKWIRDTSDKNVTFYKLWETKWKNKITGNQPFSTIKNRLHIQTIQQYYQHITLCPAVHQILDIHYDNGSKKIKYKYIDKNSNDNSSQTLPVPGSTSNTHSNTNNPDADKPSQECPQDTTVSTYHKTVPSTLIHQQYNETTTDNDSFPLFYSIVYDIIQRWAADISSRNHPFYAVWNSWEGVISSNSHFRAIQHWMQILSLQDYMTLIKGCPHIPRNIIMEWDNNNQCIHWLQTTANDTLADTTQLPSPSGLSSTSTFLLPEHFQGLLLDIKDERDSNGQTHTNRFIHFLHDKINAIMGNWGNQIRTAEKRLEDHIHMFEHSFQDLDDRLEKFRQIFNTKILLMQKQVTIFSACRSTPVQVSHVSNRQQRTLNNDSTLQSNTTLKQSLMT
jgi:hypothetical protein